MKNNYDEIFEYLKKAGMSDAKIASLKKDLEEKDKKLKEYITSKVSYYKNILPELKSVIENAKKEEDVQAFLTKHLEVALEAFSDGAIPLDIIPKFKLGQDYVTDFAVLGVRSFGKPYHVILVELESPSDNPFNKDGSYSRHLNQAIKQIQDWQYWLRNKFETFCADFSERLKRVNGPTLRNDLRSAFFTFKIVIGRRYMYSDRNRETRSSIFHTTGSGIEIMSFDKIIELVEWYIERSKNYIHPEL